MRKQQKLESANKTKYGTNVYEASAGVKVKVGKAPLMRP